MKKNTFGGIFMSLPTIPNITPNINLKRCDTINLLFNSIALNEIGLSHILNAEGEKLQLFFNTKPHELCEFLKINNSVNKVLRTVVSSQILLQFKLEEAMELNEQSHCNCKPQPPKNPCDSFPCNPCAKRKKKAKD